MRRGPTGLSGTWADYQAGNAGVLMREWDRAAHLYRGDRIPWQAPVVVIHEPLGEDAAAKTISWDCNILGLPGGKLETSLIIDGGSSLIHVYLENLQFTKPIVIQGLAQVVIRDCMAAYTGSGSAIQVQTDGNLITGVYGENGASFGGTMITITGSSNRIIGNDSRAYAGGIVDTGTGNVLVGNL